MMKLTVKQLRALIKEEFKSTKPGPTTFVGEPDVSFDTFRKAHARAAERSEAAAQAASDAADPNDAKANKQCVLLFKTAASDWAQAGDDERTHHAKHMAWKHDQILKGLTGETFGLRRP